ncbi:hypothetical protein [Azospirillum sp. sgz302134]
MEHHAFPLRAAFAAIWQRKFMVMAIGLVSVLLCAFFTSFYPRPYQAETSLLMVYHEEYADRSTDGRLDSPIRVGLAEALGTEMQILNSRALKMELVERLGPARLFPEAVKPPSMIATLFERAWLSVTGQPFDPAALRAQAVATVDDLLKRAGVSAFAQDAATDGESPEEGPAKPVLTPEQAALEQITANMNIRRIEGSNIITIQYTHADPEVAALTLNKLVELFRERREQLFADAKGRAFETEEQAAAEQLRKIEEKLNGYVRSSQSVGINDQISYLTEERAGWLRTLADPGKLLTPERRSEIRARIGQIDGQLQGLMRNAQEIQRLRFEYDMAQKTYQTYRSTLEGSRITDTLRQVRQPTIRVIDPAVPPARPIGLSAKVMMGLALLIGLLAASILAAILGPRRRALPGMPSVRAIESKLKIPVLATFDHRPLLTHRPSGAE